MTGSLTCLTGGKREFLTGRHRGNGGLDLSGGALSGTIGAVKTSRTDQI
jgi:hypothetical protein